jgi:hypothetical protein
MLTYLDNKLRDNKQPIKTYKYFLTVITEVNQHLPPEVLGVVMLRDISES